MGSSTVACQSTRCAPDEICTVANLTSGCYIPGPCLENPCENGGVCIENATEPENKTMYCRCPDTHKGDFCENKNVQGPPSPPEKTFIYIIVGTAAAVILLCTITALVVWRYSSRKNKKNPQRLNGTECTSDLNVYHDPGCAVNAAFDEEHDGWPQLH
ncbi:zonadhesin-like [Rhinatrema bivittatum]|uniref:zonadhesin-like n=1 Tax=Rhinatrema bivittatum TaxID=194408 RepID=UPI00112C38EB|nr:zonadhesin-like [Rhinatrema bivittatum]